MNKLKWVHSMAYEETPVADSEDAVIFTAVYMIDSKGKRWHDLYTRNKANYRTQWEYFDKYLTKTDAKHAAELMYLCGANDDRHN